MPLDGRIGGGRNVGAERPGIVLGCFVGRDDSAGVEEDRLGGSADEDDLVDESCCSCCRSRSSSVAMRAPIAALMSPRRLRHVAAVI